MKSYADACELLVPLVSEAWHEAWLAGVYAIGLENQAFEDASMRDWCESEARTKLHAALRGLPGHPPNAQIARSESND